MYFLSLVFLFCTLSLSWCQPDELLIPFKRLNVKPPNLHVYKQYCYPKCHQSPGDIVHALPEILVIPPVQKEIFALNGFHIVDLTRLEAKEVAEAQVSLVRYLRSSSLYVMTMIAYKRTLHMALISFLAKTMIYIMSIKATFEKLRNTVFQGTDLERIIRIRLIAWANIVKMSTKCIENFGLGFDTNKIKVAGFSITPEEYEYIFKVFIHNRRNHIPECFRCSAVAQFCILEFKKLIETVFIPMCELIRQKLNKPPMDVFKMLNIRQMQSKPADILQSGHNEQIKFVMRQYNIWQQLPTKNNPALYYIIIRSLSYVNNLVEMPFGEMLDRMPNDLEQKAHDGLEFAKGLFENMEELRIACELLTPYLTVYDLKARDHIHQLYRETFPTEETLIRAIIGPIAIFAAKSAAINAIMRVEMVPMEKMTDIFNKDSYLAELAKKQVDIAGIKANFYLGHEGRTIGLHNIPMNHALNLHSSSDLPKMETEDPYLKTRRERTVSESVRDSDFYTGSQTFNERLNEIMNFDPLTMDMNLFQEPLYQSINLDEGGRIIPKEKKEDEKLSPIRYWPLDQRKEEMTAKQGEPWNIFDFNGIKQELMNEEREQARVVKTMIGEMVNKIVTEGPYSPPTTSSPAPIEEISTESTGYSTSIFDISPQGSRVSDYNEDISPLKRRISNATISDQPVLNYYNDQPGSSENTISRPFTTTTTEGSDSSESATERYNRKLKEEEEHDLFGPTSPKSPRKPRI
ncbi:hypothetical protein SNEBB_002461 [Seison nebaliae]|nr:hypothetical protein SNEBB_002461 [Seison nebaliae]